MKYVVKRKEYKILEENQLEICRDYPNEDFETYNDCDEQFLMDVFQQYFGFYPIWVTNNKSLVSKNVTVLNFDAMGAGYVNYFDLIEGISALSCRPPCKSSSTNCVLIYKRHWTANFSMIDITFDDLVSVSIQELPGLNWTGLLADMGESMGIWLGVGAVQILAILAGFVQPRVKGFWKQIYCKLCIPCSGVFEI